MVPCLRIRRSRGSTLAAPVRMADSLEAPALMNWVRQQAFDGYHIGEIDVIRPHPAANKDLFHSSI